MGHLKSIGRKFNALLFFNLFCLIFFYMYNLQFSKQKVYSHQVLIYLNVPGIPVKKPL